jgi:hypothetical protein
MIILNYNHTKKSTLKIAILSKYFCPSVSVLPSIAVEWYVTVKQVIFSKSTYSCIACLYSFTRLSSFIICLLFILLSFLFVHIFPQFFYYLRMFGLFDFDV